MIACAFVSPYFFIPAPSTEQASKYLRVPMNYYLAPFARASQPIRRKGKSQRDRLNKHQRKQQQSCG